MKQLLCILFALSMFSYSGTAQITFRGCTTVLSAQNYTLILTGTTNDAGTIRNTYESSPSNFTQSCAAGVCEIRIIWSIGSGRWEVQLDNDGPVGAPDYTTSCLYFNSAASFPNPPDLTLGSWQDCSGGNCPVSQFVTMSGDVQDAISACSNPTVPTVTHSPTSLCAGNSTTLTISGTLNDATNWHVYTGTCGGTFVGMTSSSSLVVSPSLGNTTYFVRGEDGAGCVNEAAGTCGSVVVTVNATPTTPTISAGGATTFCTGGSVTLTSSASSGNQWLLNGTPIGGATSQTLAATTGGNYTVTSTANGCTSSASSATTVTINATPATPVISAGSATIFCSGGSVMLTSSASSGNQWLLNGTPIGGSTSQTLAVTTGGSYTVTSTVNGCTSSTSSATTVIVNQTPITPAISAGGPTTFCFGSSVVLSTTSANGNQWFFNGNPIGGATNQTLVATVAGNYTVEFTINGCSSTSSVLVVTVNTIPSAPTVSAGSATTFCAGGSVTLTSSATGGNQWFLTGGPIGGATSQTLVVTGTGNYSVGTTVNGCTSSASSVTAVTVNAIPSAPTVSAGSATTFCAGGSVMLTSSAAGGNQWFLNGTPIGGSTSQTLVATATGNYTVGTTVSGCTSSASSVTAVTVNAIPGTPTVSASGSTALCNGSPVTLTSSAAGGNQWALNGTPIGGSTSQTLVVTTAGSYTVETTVNGCTSSASLATVVTVNTTPLPVITTGGLFALCPGDSITLTSSASIGNQWYLNGNPVSGGTNQNLVIAVGGFYTTQVTSNGCTASSNLTTITVNSTPATPTISAGGSTTICSGNTLVLTSSAASGNQWFLNGNPIGGATGQTFGATATGNYTVETTNGNGCTSATSLATMVTVNPTPFPTISAGGLAAICPGDSITLTSSDSVGNQWTFNGNLISGATNPTLVITTAGIYIAEVTLNGCTSSSNPIVIAALTASSTPTISAGGATTFCTGDSISLTSSASTGNQWFLNGSSIGSATNQTLDVTAAGNYTVEATNGNGCTSSVSLATSIVVNNPVTNSQTFVECAGTSISVGSSTYTATGTYTDILTAANGCDSIITTDLTVLAPIDTTITTTLPTLTANATTATYQWVNCDSNYMHLAGATAQAYTPTFNGTYAVIVTEGSCSDTSSCYTVIVTGIKKNKLTKMLTLFPNPTSGNVNIELGQIFNEVTIKVINVTGQTLSTKSFKSTDKIDFDIEGTSGVYLLEITTDEGDFTTVKVLKK
jgi:hypothetical protein